MFHYGHFVYLLFLHSCGNCYGTAFFLSNFSYDRKCSVLKEPLNRVKVIALIISTLGITVFFEGGLNHVYGIFISLLSGVLFALYVLYVEQSQMKSMHPMLYSFYLCCYSSVLMMGYSLFYGRFYNSYDNSCVVEDPIIVALSTSIFATTFLQMGISADWSVLWHLFYRQNRLMVLCGILILHESFSVISDSRLRSYLCRNFNFTKKHRYLFDNVCIKKMKF